ncbi:MAG: alpha/beta hydrolase [Pseudomonadota bacterium]
MKRVLLPGLDGTGRLFGPLLTFLDADDRSQVVTYPVDRLLSYAQLETRVRSALPNEPFVVLGESFSSPIAIRLAASRPSNLRGVVLCCGFARNPRPGLGSLLPVLPYLPIHGRAPSLARNVLLGAVDPALRALLEDTLSGVSAEVIRHRLREIATVDVRDALAEIEVPLLYLKAGQDRLVPSSNVADVSERVGSVEVETFDGPHLLLQVLPEDCATAIQDWVRDCC